MPTNIWPSNYKLLPLCIGLFAAPWGGHTILPQLYRDARTPSQFSGAMACSWTATALIDFSMGVVGYLMYGHGIKGEVTQNVLFGTHLPSWMRYAVLIICATVSVTKYPLSTQPIGTIIERAFNIQKSKTFVAFVAVRIFIVAMPIGVAVLVPDFDRIMVCPFGLLNLDLSRRCTLLYYIHNYADPLPPQDSGTYTDTKTETTRLCITRRFYILGRYRNFVDVSYNDY